MARKSAPILGVLVGPSGGGKTELQKLLAAAGVGKRLITCTTRARRPDEIDGVDYHFLTRDDFDIKKDAGSFLEWALVHGHLYGTPKDAVLQTLSGGETVILAIDIQGLRQVQQIQSPLIERSLSSFFIYASIGTIRQRIALRAFLANKPIEVAELDLRLSTANDELLCRSECDRVIDNDRDGNEHLKLAYESLLAGIRLRQQCVAHESWRRWLGQPWLARGATPTSAPASEAVTTPTPA
ncbi:MAG: guanylate kinase [bacterium]